MLVSAEDIEEHIFELGLTAGSINSLGIHERGQCISIRVGSEEIDIKQSLDILNNHSTGGMVWEASLRLVQWLDVTSHPLKYVIHNSNILELGCGTGALACLLSPFVNSVCATDTHALMRLARENTSRYSNVSIHEYDWELHEFDRKILAHDNNIVIVACDVLYNDHVSKLFVNACTSIKRALGPVTLVFAVQLRTLELLEETLKSFTHEWSIEYIEDEAHRTLLDGIALYSLRSL